MSTHTVPTSSDSQQAVEDNTELMKQHIHLTTDGSTTNNLYHIAYSLRLLNTKYKRSSVFDAFDFVNKTISACDLFKGLLAESNQQSRPVRSVTESLIEDQAKSYKLQLASDEALQTARDLFNFVFDEVIYAINTLVVDSDTKICELDSLDVDVDKTHRLLDATRVTFARTNAEFNDILERIPDTTPALRYQATFEQRIKTLCVLMSIRAELLGISSALRAIHTNKRLTQQKKETDNRLESRTRPIDQEDADSRFERLLRTIPQTRTTHRPAPSNNKHTTNNGGSSPVY